MNILKKIQSTSLHSYESSVFSQNGEDGIIEEIFRRIGTTNKYFVEFGVENGVQNNTRHLLENRAWSGTWIEGDPQNVAQAKTLTATRPIKILEKFVTKENINETFEEAGVPPEFDFLCIDVDGNDYWIWQALRYSPRVVAIEFNILYDDKWAMPYNAKHCWDRSHYSLGASLPALFELAAERGYSFLTTDSRFTNAFFVKSTQLNAQIWASPLPNLAEFREGNVSQYFSKYPWLDLSKYEFKTYSQNGEDGVLEEIFRRLNIDEGYFVEFGAESGAVNNTRNLAEKKNWRGVWFEAKEENIRPARQVAERLNIHLVNKVLTAENINHSFSEANIPKTFELLSIRVEGNEYWLWQALDTYKPKVVVISFNVIYSGSKWIMEYHPGFRWDGTHYSIGASIDALADLGAEKGYIYVAKTSNNVNAFFVEKSLIYAVLKQ